MKNKQFRLVSLALLFVCFVCYEEVAAKRIFLFVAADTSTAGDIALSTGPDTDYMSGVFYPSTRNKVVDRLDTLPNDEVSKWSASIWRPEPGDHIVEVNGQKINDTKDFSRAVKNSPETMTFKLIGRRTGQTFTMRTKLNSPTAKSRFGVGVSDCRHDGVSVDYVRPRYPGSRCQIAR